MIVRVQTNYVTVLNHKVCIVMYNPILKAELISAGLSIPHAHTKRNHSERAQSLVRSGKTC